MCARHLLLSIALASAAPGVHARTDGLTGFTYQTGAPRTAEQERVVFERADLAFKVLPETRSLEGDATLTFRATAPIERLAVELDRNFDVSAVELDGQPLSPAAWRNPEGRMTVDLPRPLAAGESTVLRIRYAGKPHVARRAPWDGGFVWATAPTGEPWIASAIQGSGCDLFWPCIDHPLGEPRQVDQHVTVPAPLVVAGNGLAMGMEEKDGWRTYHWRAKQTNTYGIALNIGPYELMQADYASRYGNTIPLRFWHLRGNREKAKALFAEFTPMLDFFEEKIGPYPFADEKMGVVETPHLGMEHQTINAYGNAYKLSEYGYDWLLQHEFAHEWFANQLTSRDWDDMWLHEGFGTYMQPLYMQWLRGDMEYHANLMKQRTALGNRFPVVSGKPMLEADVYSDERGPGHDVYYKGAFLLHSLRALVGDEAFFEATRQLVYGTTDPRPGTFAPRHGTTRDFIEAVNAATGQDYGWFFDVYLYSAPLPELLATRGGDRLDLRWDVAGDKPFPMPVEVRVGDQIVQVPMAGGQGSVALPAGASVTLDPHSKLLRALPHIVEYQQQLDEQATAEAKKKAAGGK